MKPISRTGGRGWRIPTEDEVEVGQILLNLPRLIAKPELIGGYSFTWGRKKKRSVLDSKSESSPGIGEGMPENVTAVEARESPSSPLCLLPSGRGSDGGGNRKPPSPARKTVKRKAKDDLMEVYNRMEQEKQSLMKKVKAMQTLHQELTSENLELKARGQKINYARNMKDFYKWNGSMKVVEQQHCNQQITMFAPAPPQQPQQQHCVQQLAVDPNSGKVVAVSSGGGGGRFGLFNQVDPRVKIQEGTYDFMAASQPLDQSKYLMMMGDDIRVRAAAAARKRRILRMKESKSSLLAMKLSRACR